MNTSVQRHGFVFLVSVLAIGAMAAATTISLLLVGGAAEKSALSFSESMQAMNLADTCAERALRTLRSDLSYAGNETFTFPPRSSCMIKTIVGTGNTERILCTEGTVGSIKRKLQIRISRLLPSAIISSWQEVTSFTLCP